MIDGPLRTYLIASYLAGQQAIAWEAWHAAWLERIVLPPEVVIGLIDQMTEQDQLLHAKLIASLPTAETFTLIEDVIARLGDVGAMLRAEDPGFIARVRIDLHDALTVLRKGDLERAHRYLVAAHKRLHWIVYERKRDSTHMDRRIRDQHTFDQLVSLVEELAAFTDQLAAARQRELAAR